jgi:hypothetical protein
MSDATFRSTIRIKPLPASAAWHKILRRMSALAIRIAVLLLAIVPLRAQDEAPDIAGLTEMHDARETALADFRTARKAKLIECRATYLQVLDEALKVATDAAIAAIIRKERAGIADGLVAPADAPGLPEELAAARRVFFNGVGKASVDYDAAKKKLDAEYLKSLNKIQSQHKRDKKLSAQIAAEKRRIAEGK